MMSQPQKSIQTKDNILQSHAHKTIPAFWFIIGNTLIFTFAGHGKILRKLRLLLVRDRRIGACHLKLFVFVSLCLYTQTHAERRARSDTKRLL